MNKHEYSEQEQCVLRLANNLYYYCNTEGISTAQLEETAGVGKGYISRLLKHPDTSIRLTTIFSLSQASNIEPPKLLFTDISIEKKQMTLQRIKNMLEELENEQKGSMKTLETIEKILEGPDTDGIYKAERALKKTLDKIKKARERNGCAT